VAVETKERVPLADGGSMHAACDEDAAEDSWRRSLAFFGEHL
jgi:dienelactone hydrolase